MMSRIKYYLASIPTLFKQINNWHLFFPLLLGRRRVVIRLRAGCKFKVRSLMDVWIIKETCLDREYESQSTQIKDGWTVIDIGAGLGDFAILAASENPNSRIYAYEPFWESYEMLQENIGMNDVQNISAFQIAVGAKSGGMKLFTTGEAVQHTTMDSALSGNATSAREVQGVSLDDLFEANGIVHCDFLKIDCEGCEFDVLFGASHATLEKTSHICLEYHNGFTRYTHNDLVNHLQQRGFQVRTSPNPVHDHLGFLYAYR